jgi:hypothetical protein
MLAAIKLNDERSFDAQEIDDVWTNRSLPPKSIAKKIPPSQEVPDPRLCVGRQFSQLRCSVLRAWMTNPRVLRAHCFPVLGDWLDWKLRSRKHGGLDAVVEDRS